MSRKKSNKQKSDTTLIEAKKAERERLDNEKRRKEIIVSAIMAVCGTALLVFILLMLFNKEHSAHDTVVFKVGDEKVRKDEVNFCILQNVIDLQIDEAKLSVSPEAVKPYDAANADEYYKKEILEMIMDYKVEYMTAVNEGLALTDDEKLRVRTDVTKYLSTVNSRVLNELGITKDCIISIYEQRFLANKLLEETLESIEVEEADVDKRFATIYIMLFPKIETTDDGDYVRAADGETPVMLSDDKIEEQKENAYAAHKELVEDGADVSEVASRYGVTAFSGEQSNLIDSFESPFSEYAKDLKEGEYSQVIDAVSCYGIIKMIKENNEQISDQIIQTYQNDIKQEELDKKIDEWYDGLSISEDPVFVGNTWSEITFYDYVKYNGSEQ